MQSKGGAGEGGLYDYKLRRILKLKIEDVPGKFGEIASAIGRQGALLGDILKIKMSSHHLWRDVTIYVDDENQLSRVLKILRKIPGVHVLKVTDDVMEIHRGGKIQMVSKWPINTITELRKVYTPGVASVCREICKDPAKAFQYTYLRNTVAVVTNGSAILGLGNIGNIAGLPVMEGKCVLFEQLAGISAIPILVNSQDAQEIVETIVRISPSFGAIQLEDIAAPLCFEVERELQKRLCMPILHDDQHGTATVVLAGLIKALQAVEREKEEVKIVVNGAGAGGIAVTSTLLAWGVKDILICDKAGILYPGRKENMNPYKEEIAQLTNPVGRKGSLAEAMVGRDIFIGLSGPYLVTQEMVASMAKDCIVFALANPIPEIWPRDAINAGAKLAIDGRTLNNALAFPGLFRGALDVGACRINEAMKHAAALTLASLAPEGELVPSILDRRVHREVARAVKKAALTSGALTPP